MPAGKRDLGSDELFILIGELTESARKSANTIDDLAEEAKQANRIITNNLSSVESIRRTVNELDRIVISGNGDSLVTRVRILQETVAAVHQSCVEMDKKMDGLTTTEATFFGINKTASIVLTVIAWLIATGLSIVSLIMK